jgi:hypothetical protein
MLPVEVYDHWDSASRGTQTSLSATLRLIMTAAKDAYDFADMLRDLTERIDAQKEVIKTLKEIIEAQKEVIETTFPTLESLWRNAKNQQLPH